MSKLCEILGIKAEDGQELTIEDYETAFESVNLVDKKLLDQALSDKAKLTKENRVLTTERDEALAQIETEGNESNVEVEKLKKRLDEMTQENLRTKATALFIEKGFDKELADTFLSTLTLDDDLEGVTKVLDTLSAREETVAKTAIKGKAKIETPPAPKVVPEKEKLAKEYAKLMKGNDVQGVAELKAKNPDIFSEIVSEYVPSTDE